MSALQTWIQPAPVISSTSTALDWSTTAMDAWFLNYPASKRLIPLTEAYSQSLRLDLAAQPAPLFQHAMHANRLFSYYFKNGSIPLENII